MSYLISRVLLREISLLELFYRFRSYQGFKLCFNILKGCFHLCVLFGWISLPTSLFFFPLVRMSLVQTPSLLLIIISLNSLNLHFHTCDIGTIQVLNLLKCWGGRRGNDVIDLISVSFCLVTVTLQNRLLLQNRLTFHPSILNGNWFLEVSTVNDLRLILDLPSNQLS